MERRDQVLALFLDELGIGNADLATFEGRKRLQKAIYLVEQAPFGRDFGFRYNLYIRGPYCSELADAGYRLLRDENGWREARQLIQLKDDCKQELGELRSRFSAGQGHPLDADMLELAATVHFLWSFTFGYVKAESNCMRRIQEWVRQNKPELVSRLGEAVDHLRSLQMVPSNLGEN